MILISNTSFSDDTLKILTISEGLRLATDNNRLIKIASLNKNIASSDISIARSKLLPIINASLRQTYLSHQPGAMFGQDRDRVFISQKEYLSYGINLYQTIYDFGANISRYEASKTFLDVTNLDIARIRNLVALDFINTYFDLLETEKMIELAEKEVERFESHLKVAQSLYAEGTITKNGLLQAEVMLSDAKQRLLTMKNRKAIDISRINTILARPINEDLQVVDVPMDISQGVELEKAWEMAEKQRREVKIIDHELKIIDLEEKAAKSEYYPKLFAQGGYNFTENLYQFPEGNWSVILGIDLNLFSGGSTKAEVSKVLHRREQLLEEKRKLMDNIKLEVEKSYLDLKNALEKILVTKGAANQAEENLRINKIKYEEGIGTSTDVIDAITLLTLAETNYCRALYELRRAQAELRYATGSDLVSVYASQ
ncbi:MAG TPA: TolC family protein [Thermodesulfovibrionales bacterium]|nr:TolC family protein [Thermodesulfovibrionales bacterium]